MKKVLAISLLAFATKGSGYSDYGPHKPDEYGSNSIKEIKAYEPELISIGAEFGDLSKSDYDDYAQADPYDMIGKSSKGERGKPGQPGPPGPPGPPGKCSCNRGRKPREFGYGQSKNLDFIDGSYGYGDDLFYGGNEGGYGGGYGSHSGPQPLSGASYQPQYNAMPVRYDDGYRADQNANIYQATVPKASLLDGGYGNINGYGTGQINNRINQGYGGASYGGSSIGASAGYGGHGHVDKGYGKSNAERANLNYGNAEAKKADLYLNADLDLKQDGYNENLEYKGDELYEDAAAKKQAFNKGEAYVSEGFNGYDKESKYAGNAVYQQDDVATDLKVAYEVDHSLKFRNDYNDENHRGSYQGDEFEVDYSVTDVQGGYIGKEVDRQSKAAKYEGLDANGDFTKGGKYYGDDYLKYGDEDKDVDYRARGFGKPEDGKYGGYPGDDYYYYGDDDVDLYGRYKGDKGGKGPVYGKGRGNGGYAGGPSFSRHRIDEDKDKDTGYRAYGADFEGKDYFGKKYEAEAYAGAEEKLKENIAFDKGNYRDVKAKGKNNAAQYAGDYQTNKKAQDVDFKVFHYEDLQQDLVQDVKSDQYVAGYEGNDFKGALEADKKYGEYNDQEVIKKQDARRNAKRYAGDEYANGIDRDADTRLFYGARVAEDDGSYLKANPAGYRGEPRKEEYNPYGYNDNQLQDGNYGYYDFQNPRGPRRLATEELDALRAEIGALRLSKIASSKDMIFGVMALLLASIIGSATFIGIMHLNGYKAKKVASTDFESLESEN